METVPAKLTKKLVMEAEELIAEGWYASKSELIRDAVRELVRKRKTERIEEAIREDVTWGLYGKKR